MKKVLKLFFVLILLLVQIVPTLTVNALSGNSKDDKGTLTINNAISGKTYKVYRILDLESFDQGKAYAYKVNTKWSSFVNSSDILSKYLEFDDETGEYVSWVGDDSAERVAGFAKLALKWAEDHGITHDYKQTASSAKVEFKDIPLGYYLLDSSTGALCSLDTTDLNPVIEEKNTIPQLDKSVSENGEYGDSNTASIGDVVEFKTEITVGKGAQNYVLHDTMSEGLSLVNTSFVVTAQKENNTTVTTTGKYTVNTNPSDGKTFTITFTDAFVTEVGYNGKITVQYNAILNEKAVIGGNGNLNNTNLTYGDNDPNVNNATTPPTKTYTYGFDLVKTKEDRFNKEVLEGAEFELYTMKNSTKTYIKVELIDETNNTYRVLKDQTATGVRIKAGVARIIGLDAGTYKLEEKVIPNGYNKLAQDPEITLGAVNYATVTDNKYVSGGLRVINYTGAELPSTGGMGTVLFLIIGSIMVLGFGVLLVTKLRMSKVSM